MASATDRPDRAGSTDRAQVLRRRNLRTGWVLAAVAFGLALSIWYVRAG